MRRSQGAETSRLKRRDDRAAASSGPEICFPAFAMVVLDTPCRHGIDLRGGACTPEDAGIFTRPGIPLCHVRSFVSKYPTGVRGCETPGACAPMRPDAHSPDPGSPTKGEIACRIPDNARRRRVGAGSRFGPSHCPRPKPGSPATTMLSGSDPAPKHAGPCAARLWHPVYRRLPVRPTSSLALCSGQSCAPCLTPPVSPCWKEET